jgi:hypothetical protein
MVAGLLVPEGRGLGYLPVKEKIAQMLRCVEAVAIQSSTA